MLFRSRFPGAPSGGGGDGRDAGERPPISERFQKGRSGSARFWRSGRAREHKNPRGGAKKSGAKPRAAPGVEPPGPKPEGPGQGGPGGLRAAHRGGRAERSPTDREGGAERGRPGGQSQRSEWPRRAERSGARTSARAEKPGGCPGARSPPWRGPRSGGGRAGPEADERSRRRRGRTRSGPIKAGPTGPAARIPQNVGVPPG